MCVVCGNFSHIALDGLGETGTDSAASLGSIPQLANYLVNGYWQFNNTIAHHWGSNTITFNLGNLTAAEQSLALAALNAWDDVANIKFVQSTSANINFNHDGSQKAFAQASWTSAGIMTSCTVDISSDWAGGAGTGFDSYLYQTYIHEIGHALGLGHQGPYNGSAKYGVDNIFTNDTWQFAVMSYNSQENFDSGSYRFVLTPQMSDITAIQSIYGAASTRTGDSIYGFNSNAGFPYNFSSFGKAPAWTIYDSGGFDTLDASGYSNNQGITLAPGGFSNIGGLVHNIGIFTTTIIERALGGSGHDFIVGNEAANILHGNGGNDTLFGGGASDAVYGNIGNDVIYGNIGIDAVFGGQNDDLVFGGQDNDHVYGNLGNDNIYGNLGNDSLFGGQGNDRLFGGQGNDNLSGNLGNDTYFGGLGADTYAFTVSSGTDIVMDFNFGAGDRLSVFGQSRSVSTASDGSALVTLSGGGSVQLFGVSASSVTDSYFV